MRFCRVSGGECVSLGWSSEHCIAPPTPPFVPPFLSPDPFGLLLLLPQNVRMRTEDEDEESRFLDVLVILTKLHRGRQSSTHRRTVGFIYNCVLGVIATYKIVYNLISKLKLDNPKKKNKKQKTRIKTGLNHKFFNFIFFICQPGPDKLHVCDPKLYDYL